MRLLGFLLGGLIVVLVAASSPALAQGFVGGLQRGGFVGGFRGGGHFVGFHGDGHFRDFDGGDRHFGGRRFHDGRFGGFGHRAQGFVSLGSAVPFGLYEDQFVSAPPFGRDSSVGGLSGSSSSGFGLLATGGPSSDETLLRADQIDPTRNRWIEPAPGECPPYEKLFVRAGQRKPRCADPALEPGG